MTIATAAALSGVAAAPAAAESTLKVCRQGLFSKPDQPTASIRGTWGPDTQLLVRNINALGAVGRVDPAYPLAGVNTTFTLLPSQSKIFKLPMPGQLVTYIPQANGATISTTGDAASLYWEVQSSVCDKDEAINTVSGGRVAEPAKGSLGVRVSVTMGRKVLAKTTLAYSTTPGTATAGSDYTSTSGLLTFNPGEQTKAVTIPVLADSVVEGEESFTFNVDGNASPQNPTSVYVANPKRSVQVYITDTPPTTPPTTPPPPVVTNAPPTAKISYSRINGTPGKVYLNGSGSNDPDGNTAALKYEWLVGGSLKATTMNASMVFPTGSTQNITLRVTDEKGGVGLASQSIYLVNRAPTFSGMSPENGHIAGSNQPVLGATATDLDGDKLTYSYRITGDRVDVPSDATVTGTQWTVPPSRLDPGAKYTWSVTVSDGTTSVTSTRNISIAMLPVAADVVSTASGQGYWQVASDGGVFTHGDAQFYGSVPGLGLRLTNLMGMARTPSGNGYWVVGSDGGVFSFGDAAFYGSLPGQNIRVNNITGMVPTKSGKGYWLVGTDGGVFSFGDAQFYGSMGGKPLNKPVTAMAATASGGGYWLVARDGGIFSFGDAPFYGSMGGQQLNYPVVDMDVTPDGGGYWLTAEDGGVFSFGNAQFYGSMAGKQLNGHINGMASTPSGRGYWLNGCDGGVFTFGDAPFKGAQSTYQCRGIFYQ